MHRHVSSNHATHQQTAPHDNPTILSHDRVSPHFSQIHINLPPPSSHLANSARGLTAVPPKGHCELHPLAKAVQTPLRTGAVHQAAEQVRGSFPPRVGSRPDPAHEVGVGGEGGPLPPPLFLADARALERIPRLTRTANRTKRLSKCLPSLSWGTVQWVQAAVPCGSHSKSGGWLS